MKKTLACALVAAGIMAGSSAALAQSTATATATGTTTIIRPLTISKDVDLAFGRIVKPGTGSGTVAVANTGSSALAGSGAIALPGLAVSHAQFTMAGEGGQLVNVTVPASFDMALVGGTGQKITVSLDPDLGTSTTLSNALGVAGSKTLNVGGHFSLPSTQDTGAYSGTFDVTVAYN